MKFNSKFHTYYTWHVCECIKHASNTFFVNNSTCPILTSPFILYIAKQYQIEIIADKTSSSLIDDCIIVIMFGNIIVGYNNIDFVLSLVEIEFLLEL